MKKFLILRTGNEQEGKLLNMKLKNIKVKTSDGEWTLKNDGKKLMRFEDFNEAEFFFNKLLDFRTTDEIYLDLNEVKNDWNEKKNKMK